MIWRVWFLSIWLTTTAFAQGGGAPNPKPLSEENLAAAEAEIAAMSGAELRALIAYFAECNDRASNNALVQHACRTARVKYQTSYGDKRAIDAAIDEAEYYVEARRLIVGSGHGTVADRVDARLRTAAGQALRRKGE